MHAAGHNPSINRSPRSGTTCRSEGASLPSPAGGHCRRAPHSAPQRSSLVRFSAVELSTHRYPVARHAIPRAITIYPVAPSCHPTRHNSISCGTPCHRTCYNYISCGTSCNLRAAVVMFDIRTMRCTIRCSMPCSMPCSIRCSIRCNTDMICAATCVVPCDANMRHTPLQRNPRRQVSPCTAPSTSSPPPRCTSSIRRASPPAARASGPDQGSFLYI